MKIARRTMLKGAVASLLGLSLESRMPMMASSAKAYSKRRLGIIRIDRQLYEELGGVEGMQLPKGTVVDAVSLTHYFSTDDVAVRVSHPNLPVVTPGQLIREYVGICCISQITGKFKIVYEWAD